MQGSVKVGWPYWGTRCMIRHLLVDEEEMIDWGETAGAAVTDSPF